MFDSVLEVSWRVPLIFPFALGALILLWAFAAGALAFTGGISSGMHETSPLPEQRGDARPTDRSTMLQEQARKHVFLGQVFNFLIAGAVLFGIGFLLYGMFFIGGH
jgi:hypothetical protein